MKKRGNRRWIGVALAVALLAVLGWRLRGLYRQVEEARLERDRYQQQVETLEKENAALAADIEEGVTQEKIEEIARSELGMALPDEYIFYNNGG